MSDLQRRWAKAKLSAMAEVNELDEQREHGYFQEHAAATGDDSSSASSVSSVGTIMPSPRLNLFARPQGLPHRNSLDQIPWTAYFERELFFPCDTGSVIQHAYLTSPVGKGPLFITHHGAGSSGLSFAVLSAEIRRCFPTAGILSPDARGHGSTTSTCTGTPDLSLGTLASDLRAVIHLTLDHMRWKEIPSVILVGHSLGGAVVTELAQTWGLDASEGLPPLLGYAVLDVVEGSAMDALQSMERYLATRPAGFASVREGIEWHVRSRTLRNAVSARVSVPGLLIKGKEGASRRDERATLDEREEDRQSAGQQQPLAPSESNKPWQWRTDLAATQPFWADWFVGLSKKFLAGKGGKMLLLTGTDRLDTDLTIGQMQGKYALQVFPEAGHFIHEDLPEKTAVALVDFLRRNDRSAFVLPPKVSELLAQGRRV